MISQFMGWTRDQWMYAAAFYKGPLPLIGDDAMHACQVQDYWFQHRDDEPSKPCILLTNVIGQVFEQPQRSDHLVWAARVMHQAAKQFSYPPLQPEKLL